MKRFQREFVQYWCNTDKKDGNKMSVAGDEYMQICNNLAKHLDKNQKGLESLNIPDAGPPPTAKELIETVCKAIEESMNKRLGE